MFNHPYICLSTDKELDKQSIINWFKSVASDGPPGVLSAIELTPNNKPRRFYYRKINGANRYCAVLCRDLEGEEYNHVMLILALMAPYKQTNNQHCWTDYYKVSDIEYHVTTWPNDEPPTIAEYLPE